MGVAVSLLDLVVQAGMAVFGLALLFDWHALTADVDLGVKPTWSALAFAFPIAMIGFTGLEKVPAWPAWPRTRRGHARQRPLVGVHLVMVYAAVATAADVGLPDHPDPAPRPATRAS